MNTYNENLRIAVSNALTGIDDTQQERQSAQTVAHYNLYYAVGEQILAQDKLDRVNETYDAVHAINHQGVACSNRANNLFDSATMADENVTTLVTNTATAAQNVQIAANAVVKLAADIGAAKNIVNASEADTDIMRMTVDVNETIAQTAYLAEVVSKTSMDSSAESAQIIAKEVLDEATVTQTWFTDMLKRTSGDLDTLTQTRIDDTNNLVAANSTQRTMEGRLKVAHEEVVAVKRSYKTSNTDLNLDITATALNKNSFTVQFDKMVAPFPFKSHDASKAMNNEYYVCVSKYETQAMFTTDVAQTSFNAYGPDAQQGEGNDKDIRFVKVEDTEVNTIHVGVDPTPKTADIVDNLLWIEKDIDGDKIVAGQSYVVFIYTALDPDYKREVNNYNDALSAASQSFTMTTTLQTVTAVTQSCVCKMGDDNELDTLSVQFSIDPRIEPKFAEYRVILVPNESLCHSDDRDATNCEQSSVSSMDVWFDKEIAEQVAEVNYKVAKPSDKILAGCQEGMQSMVATFDVTDSDNFGQLLIPGHEYVYWVLAIVTELQTKDYDQYTSTLTKLDHGVIHQEDSLPGGNAIEQELEKIKEEVKDYVKQLEQVEKDKLKLDDDKKELEEDKQTLIAEIAELKKLLAEKDKASGGAADKGNDTKATASKNTTATKTAANKRNQRGNS